MVRYKIDILKALKDTGWSQTKLTKNQVLSSMTIQNMRDRTKLQNLSPEEIAEDPRLSKMKTDDIMLPNLESLNNICIILGVQLSDIIEIVDTDEEVLKFHRLKNKR